MSKDYLAIWKDQENYPDFTPHLEELISKLSDYEALLKEIDRMADIADAQEAAEDLLKKHGDL